MPSRKTPKSDKAEADAKARPQLTVQLGKEGDEGDVMVVPHVEHLTLKERFAIRSTTGMAPEQLWTFAGDEPLGRDRLAVWYWVAHARASGSNGNGLPPISLIERVLDEAADDGKTLRAALVDPDEKTEGEGDDDPEG